MELRQLRYFLRVADTLHFGHAAAAEHIAQSALSTQISRLESELGVQLFTRTSRSVALTPAGTVFREYADLALADVAAGVEAAQFEGRSERARIRVGALTSDLLMHGILAAFRTRFPTVELTFVELTMTNQIEKVVDGEVDVAFIWLPISDSRVNVSPLYSDPLVAVVPVGHALAGAHHLRAEELVDEPFAIPSEGASKEWRSHWALDQFRGRGPRIGAQVASVREVLAAIAYGGVVDTATVNSGALAPHPGVRYIPIIDAEPSTLGLVARKNTSNPMVETFRLTALETVRERIHSLPGATLP